MNNVLFMHIMNTANQLSKQSAGILLLQVAMRKNVFKQLATCRNSKKKKTGQTVV